MPVYGGVRRSWIELHRQHKAQCHSLSAAWMIFISGGMKIAWSIYEQPLIRSHNSKIGVIHLTISWFVGAIIGCKVTAMFAQRMSRTFTYYLGGMLVTLGGLLFLVFPGVCPTILAGRYLDGCAFGAVLLQTIITGGEVSVRFLRGTIMTTERIFLWIGICLQLGYSTLFFDKTVEGYSTLVDDRFHGGMSVILGLLSLILTANFSIESPVYLHVNHREQESLSSLMRLQGCTHPNDSVFEIFDDNKLWIGENASQSFKDEIHSGTVAFIKLIFLRSLVSLAMSLPFHWAYILTNKMAFQTNFFIIAYGLAGLVGSVASILFMDCQGRRMTSAISLCIGGALLVAVGGIFLEFEVNIDLVPQMKVVTILLLAYQVINAFGFAPATTIYISEAFALPLKTFFISGIVVFENLVQAVTCYLAFTVTINYAVFFLTVGLLNCAACLVIVFWFPETKKLTLRECNHLFAKGSVG